MAFAFKYVGFNIDVGYWREIFYLEAEIKVARQSEAEAFERSLGIELRALWNSLTYTPLKPPESSKSKSRKSAKDTYKAEINLLYKYENALENAEEKVKK